LSKKRLPILPFLQVAKLPHPKFLVRQFLRVSWIPLCKLSLIEPTKCLTGMPTKSPKFTLPAQDLQPSMLTLPTQDCKSSMLTLLTRNFKLPKPTLPAPILKLPKLALSAPILKSPKLLFRAQD
jgi:hypothetical protein